MNHTTPTQSELWNGRVGDKWVALHECLEAMLMHVTDELVHRP